MRDNAANWLELAEKVWHYRRDRLSAKESDELVGRTPGAQAAPQGARRRGQAEARDRVARGRPGADGRGDLPEDLARGERGVLPRRGDRDPRHPDLLRPAVQDPDELDVADLLRDDGGEPAPRHRRPESPVGALAVRRVRRRAPHDGGPEGRPGLGPAFPQGGQAHRRLHAQGRALVARLPGAGQGVHVLRRRGARHRAGPRRLQRVRRHRLRHVFPGPGRARGADPERAGRRARSRWRARGSTRTWARRPTR